MRNLERISFKGHGAVGVRYCCFQQRQHHVLIGLPRALVTIELAGRVRNVIVPGNRKNRLTVELIEADRSLWQLLLPRFVNVERLAEIKRIWEMDRRGLRSNLLQLRKILFLQPLEDRVIYLAQ